MSCSNPHRRTLLSAMAAVAVEPWLAACGTSPVGVAARFDAWAEGFAADWVRGFPELATFRQYFSGAEQDALDRRLNQQAQGEWSFAAPLLRTGLAQLDCFDPATLTPPQRLAAATLRWSLRTRLDGAPYEDHRFAFNQFWGVHVGLVQFMNRTHPMRRPADMASWLARLDELGVRIDEARGRAAAAATRGLLPPRFIAERSRAQVADFLSAPAAANTLVATLAERSAHIDAFGADARSGAHTQAKATVEAKVLPAYRRLLEWLDGLLPRTGDDAGLWRLPEGDAAYAAALAQFTTTTMGAHEIHALGLHEVARIEAEMNLVLRTLGRRDGSVAERLRRLNEEAQPPAEPDPRPALLTRYAAYVREAQQRAAPLFRLLPRAAIEVRREPALTEHTAAASYQAPAADGSRPGIFWVPLPGPHYEILRMKSLAVHEAVPGHHFQIALHQELRGLPHWQQRAIFGGGAAYSEGWALYAEALAIEQGWYEGDPHALLGALDLQLLRARRLVVDTGLHALRWTREQAIRYGIRPAEVERYVAIPGQACAYMIGMHRLVELRDEARHALDARFALPAFHNAVLGAGSVPLDVLGEAVRGWVAGGGAADPDS